MSSTLEMSSSDSSQQSTSSKLAENSAFREAENEVISIVTKVSFSAKIQSKYRIIQLLYEVA